MANQFTVCGGLKLNDAAFDQALFNTHHSARVVDFAIALQNFARTKVLKDNRRLVIKFGINHGSIVSSVIGEYKPQYSLFGETLEMAKEACAGSKKNQILVTTSMQERLNETSNNFNFSKTAIYVG